MHETSPSRHRTPRRRRAALGLVVALALALAAAACGSDDATSTADGGSTTTADSAETTTTTAPAALPTEVQDEVQGILDASLEPGAIAWDCCGADAPPTGAALAVRIPGHADLLVSSGSDLTGAEFDPTAPFLTGTLATSIVRTIAIQLVEEGELDPEATLDEFVAGLTGAEEITVQMLIDGTDGLGDFDGIDARNIIADYERVWTLDEVLATFEGRPPASPPGERWAAGLVGSAALASILEQTTGTSFSDLVRERVTEPLALDETAVDDGVDLPAGSQGGVFVLDGTIIETSDVPTTSYFTFNTATSSVMSTLPDLLDLLDAWMEGELFADGRRPTPDDFPSERTADAGDLIAAQSVPVNGYCPCEPAGEGNTTSSIGRGPNAPGSDLWLIEYPDGISVALHYNSNEEVDKTALRDVADQAHEAAATAL